MKFVYILCMLIAGLLLGAGGLIRWGAFLVAPEKRPFRSTWDRRGFFMMAAGIAGMIVSTAIYETSR
ncbi:hypothetical protein [Xanthomonas arboricola]|uniref:hypothetical protein n=1 Tax=Xanthomonas arboricola TaxID=56448 RepID=UPI00168F1F79|nr:hypothetical protein [Xanthomonas arboricola]NJB93497.1 hypothetical protein [Xanthomonas arboricola]